MPPARFRDIRRKEEYAQHESSLGLPGNQCRRAHAGGRRILDTEVPEPDYTPGLSPDLNTVLPYATVPMHQSLVAGKL